MLKLSVLPLHNKHDRLAIEKNNIKNSNNTIEIDKNTWQI